MKHFLQKGEVIICLWLFTITTLGGQATAQSLFAKTSTAGVLLSTVRIANLAAPEVNKSGNGMPGIASRLTSTNKANYQLSYRLNYSPSLTATLAGVAAYLPPNAWYSTSYRQSAHNAVAFNASAPASIAFASTKQQNNHYPNESKKSNLTARAAGSKGPDAALTDIDKGSYNTPFVRCSGDAANRNYTLQVRNASASKGTNKSYHIDWGDNETEVFDSSFEVASHTYNKLGTFNLVLTVTGNDGSTATKTYEVYNGRGPNLTMGSPDNTGGCAPQTYVFPIGGIANNSPGTVYTFTFNDGSEPLVYTQETIPAAITHVFTQSSCSRPGSTFTLTGKAENACGNTEVTVVSRKIGAKPLAGFSLNKETICTDGDIQATNTSQNGSSVSNAGVCIPSSVYNWKIEPATGWTLTAGNETAKDIAIRFTATGNYKITLTAGNDCGADVLTREVKVIAPPKASFTLNQSGSCNGLTAAATNASAGDNLRYAWSVSPGSGYTVENGTLSSANPVFKFTSPGKYTVSLTASSGCSSSTATQEVNVKGTPLVTLPQAQTYCSPQTIRFSATNSTHQPVVQENFGTITAYSWSVSGNAKFVSPTNQHSQFPEIEFPAAGTYTVTLKATNECGESTAATQVITIDNVTEPVDNTLPQQERQICSGESVTIPPGAVTAANSGTYTYLWESSTTSASAGFEAASGVNTGTTYSTDALTTTTWFRRKVLKGSCTISTSSALKVVVTPAITDNTITGEQAVCAGAVPAKLTGAEPAGGLGSGSFTYTWEFSTTSATSGFQTIPGATERDFTPAPEAPVTWYRRIARSGKCELASAAVQVTVNPIPAVAEVTEPEICAGGSAVLTVTNAGGTCNWFSDETATTAVHTGDSFTTPALSATTVYYIAVTNDLGCSSPRKAVTVTVYPLTTVNTISSNQLICVGEKPKGLTGSSPTGGNGTYVFVWEQSTDNTTYSPAAGINSSKDYQPTMLTQTTWFRRRVISNSCENTSDPVQVVVNTPIQNNSISGSQTVCAGAKPAALQGSLPVGGGSNFTYLWEYSTVDATTGFAPAPGPNDGADYVPGPLMQNTWFRRKVVSMPCQESYSQTVLIMLEKKPEMPHASGVTLCPGNKATLTASAPIPAYNLQWFNQPAGGVVLHTGPSYTTSPLLSTTDFYVQCVSPNGCPSTRVKVTATVVAPVVSAGPDATIIKGRGAQLHAKGGTSYSWSPATSLSNPLTADPLATPSETTTYTVTITTAEGCSFTDEVTITVMPAIEITNALTVNGDGINDTWFIRNIENYPNCHIQVFTRWGARIFESVGYRIPWDGTHQGKELPMAAYYYIIKLNDKEDAITGSITLIK